jgi:hypothetical protein
MLSWILVRLKPFAGLFGCDSIRKFSSQLLDISVARTSSGQAIHGPTQKLQLQIRFPSDQYVFLFLGIMTHLTTISTYQTFKGPKWHDHLENDTEIEFINRINSVK